MIPSDADRSELLAALGARVRAHREESGVTREALARASGLSARFLAALEGGTGNISVGRLLDLARALGTTPSALLRVAETPPAALPLVALLGLRGAGKTTIGAALARRLGIPFLELDERI